MSRFPTYVDLTADEIRMLLRIKTKELHCIAGNACTPDDFTKIEHYLDRINYLLWNLKDRIRLDGQDATAEAEAEAYSGVDN